MLWIVAYRYPIIAASCFYLSWIVAWLMIGHQPRPMLDDPENIGGVMDIAYVISMVAVMSVPMLTPVGFAASFFCPVNSDRNRIAKSSILAIVYIGMCFALWLLVRADPGDIFEWWMD